MIVSIRLNLKLNPKSKRTSIFISVILKYRHYSLREWILVSSRVYIAYLIDYKFYIMFPQFPERSKQH